MDKLSGSSRSIASAPCFEHLPHEVMQQVLSYLPIRGTRNVFKLLSRGYRDSTDYLRVAGLVQARIRSKVLGETQAQASNRFAGLANDCMDPRLPASTTISLLMELINMLPDLPVAALSAATRAVLVSSKRLGEKAGSELSEKCMERCIRTYQRRSEMDAQVPRFEPLDDEEAKLAATYFCSELDPAILKLDQVPNVDKLSSVSRCMEASPCLEQLPHEVLQQILHYLPVKMARNAFRLVSRNYRAGTDYLRVAGMVQTRIRNKIATESQQQAERRVAGLINDCLNSAFPAALRHSLIIEFISTLPQLPGVSHAEAMRVVLSHCDMLGEQSGQAIRKKYMALCIHAYQRRTELEPTLDRFRPANDDEALIAADYFVDEIDPSTVPFMNVINHLKNLLAAMDMANTMNDREQGGRALIIMCDHCVDLFAVARGGTALRQSAGVEMVVAMKALFVEKALLLLPGKSINCQAALVSVILDLAARDSPTRKQAVKDGRKLVLKTPAAVLPENLMRLATSLFRKGVINSLIKRVEAWPEQRIKLAMLRQLAVVAWEKGAMEYMEHLAALISKLEPPDPVALQALLHANRSKSTSDQMEAAARDVIPYLFCVASGLSRAAVIESLNILIFKYLMLTPQNFKKGLKTQVRSLTLLPYLVSSQSRWLSTYCNSNEPQLRQVAGAARSAARGAADGAGSASAVLSTIPTTEAMMRMLKEFNLPGSKSRAEDDA